MGIFSDAFGAENKTGPRGEKGKKGKEAPADLQPDPLISLSTLFSDRGHSEIHWPYPDAASEPRCPSCRHWWPIPGKTWAPTGEQMADCTLHNFEVLSGDNCKLHRPLMGSAYRRNEP